MYLPGTPPPPPVAQQHPPVRYSIFCPADLSSLQRPCCDPRADHSCWGLRGSRTWVVPAQILPQQGSSVRAGWRVEPSHSPNQGGLESRIESARCEGLPGLAEMAGGGANAGRGGGRGEGGQETGRMGAQDPTHRSRSSLPLSGSRSWLVRAETRSVSMGLGHGGGVGKEGGARCSRFQASWGLVRPCSVGPSLGAKIPPVGAGGWQWDGEAGPLFRPH